MTERLPVQSNRPELGIAVFQPQTVRPEIQLYRETLDPDQKAIILNRDIVQIEEDSTATPETVKVLALIASEQNRGISQYRSDVVVDLNPENLVAVVNGLSSDEEGVIDPLSSAIRRIQQTQERAMLAEIGIDLPANVKDDKREALEQEIMEELVERLNEEDLNYSEHRQLIAAIDTLITPQALRRLSRKGDVLAALVKSADEFSNEDLREVLKRMGENFDRNFDTPGYTISDSPF